MSRRIRRLNSFSRMDRLMDQASAWFAGDDNFIRAFDDFAMTNAGNFIPDANGTDSKDGQPGWYVFSPDAADPELENARKRSLHRKDVHTQFYHLFDDLFTEWVSRKNVSPEQFQSILELTHEHEQRDGTRIFRFQAAADYPIFLTAMRVAYRIKFNLPPPTTALTAATCGLDAETPHGALVANVLRLEHEAVTAHRRKAVVAPLIQRWDVNRFQDVLTAFDACVAGPTVPSDICETGPIVDIAPPPKAVAKDLARWRVRLLAVGADTPAAGGTPPDSDRNELQADDVVRYIGVLTEHWRENAFNLLMHRMDAYVDALFPESDSSPRASRFRRRNALYRIVREMDPLHSGRISSIGFLMVRSSAVVGAHWLSGCATCFLPSVWRACARAYARCTREYVHVRLYACV